MRSQVYEWTNLAPSGSTSTYFRKSTDVTVAMTLNQEASIFIGGVGYNITKPAETTATQFVVIEDVALTPLIGLGSLNVAALTGTVDDTLVSGTPTASSANVGNPATATSGAGDITTAVFNTPTDGASAITVTCTTTARGFAVGDTITFSATPLAGAATGTFFITLSAADVEVLCNGGHAQIRINTTDYFQNPDVTDQEGIPGAASPYPRGIDNGAVTADYVLKSFDLYPDIYVLPGQVWDVLYTAGAALVATNDFDTVAVFVKYTLYDGPDALIANKLLELGITVNPNNVDWYKRTLIEQQSAASMGATA